MCALSPETFSRWLSRHTMFHTLTCIAVQLAVFVQRACLQSGRRLLASCWYSSKCIFPFHCHIHMSTCMQMPTWKTCVTLIHPRVYTPLRILICKHCSIHTFLCWCTYVCMLRFVQKGRTEVTVNGKVWTAPNWIFIPVDEMKTEEKFFSFWVSSSFSKNVNVLFFEGKRHRFRWYRAV